VNVCRTRNITACEIIDGLDAGQQLGNRVKLIAVLGERLCAIVPEIVSDLIHIEVRWICMLKRPHITFLPVANEIAVQRARPAHAPFQKSEIQRGKPAGDATQE
jgi:hypothetical protein